MSMSTVLASFFAPHGTDMEWNTEYNWQPIPIFSEPLDQDSVRIYKFRYRIYNSSLLLNGSLFFIISQLLLVRTPCPRFFEARDEVFQMSKVKTELADQESLFQNLTKFAGVPIKSADDVNSLYNTLLAEVSNLLLELSDYSKNEHYLFISGSFVNNISF